MSQRGDDLAPSLSGEAAAALPSWLAALGRPAVWPRTLAAVQPGEVAAWAAVLVAAAVLRLAALANLPLGPDEGRLAMEGWRLWLGRAPTDIEGAALLTHSLLLTFGLFGASDFAARLPTAVAGIALTLAPLLLRPLLGAVGALGAGALLALSPIVVFGSRHVDSAILVAAVLALLVGMCVRAALATSGAEASGVRAEDRPGASPTRGSDTSTQGLAPGANREGMTLAWPTAVPVLAALLLCAGSVAVPAALAALVAATITWWPARRGADAPAEEAPASGGPLRRAGAALGDQAVRLLPTPPWLALALFVGTLLLVSTAGLTHLRGLHAALVDPWVSWLAPYYPRAVPVPWLVTLLVYDLPLVVAALAGLAIVVRRNRPFEHFLLWWTTLSAVPLVFQPPDPLPLLLCWAVPLALLGGVALGHLTALAWTWRDTGKDVVLALLLAIDLVFVVNTLRLITSSVGTPVGLGPRGRDLVFSLMVVVVLAVVHLRVAGWWREALRDVPGGARLSRVTALGLLTLGVAFSLLANDRLQFGREAPGGAELLRPEALLPGAYAVADEALTWAQQEPHMTIAVSTALRPALLWHLRDAAPVQFFDRPPDPGTAPLVRRGLWPAGPDAPAGERRPLRETVAIGPIPSTTALWNWWLYRNAWLVPTRHDIIVVR